MIDETKALLLDRNVSRALIVDDAFDDTPKPGDVGGDEWNRFFDDLTEEGERKLQHAFGESEYAAAADSSALSRDRRFVALLWGMREELPGVGQLFAEYQRTQETKRSALRPLQQLLSDLSLTYDTTGRDDPAKYADAQLIFFDLFLGKENDEGALKTAIEGVASIVAARRASPPTVVLMSASHRLTQVGTDVRDQGGLLGCQFRMVAKSSFNDRDALVEQIYELVRSFPDAVKLHQYIMAWEDALTSARETFLKTIRTLDLTDYANLQALVLEAEGQRVGDYVIDLYDLHLNSVVEGDERLIRAAKELNTATLESDVPGQFMPSPQVEQMMDGAFCHHEIRTRVEIEGLAPAALRFGDVLMGPIPKEVPTGNDSDVEREALVVLSQPCDLQHGNVDRFLLLRGLARRYQRNLHGRSPKGTVRTPFMIVNGDRMMIEWNLLKPETWLRDEAIQRLTSDGFTVVRQFRTPFALHLQQQFLGNLGRVGTMVTLPARFAAGLKIYAKSASDAPILLSETARSDDDAVCLVGRTAKNETREWLLVSESLQRDLRTKLRDTANLAPEIVAVGDDPAFFRLLKRGLEFKRDKSGGSRPLSGSKYDVLHLFTVAQVTEGKNMARLGPLLVEIDVE